MFGKLVFGTILIFVELGGVAVATPIEREHIHVVDGDTIRVFNEKPDVRLVGFNAPETRRAKCPEERALGDVATRRLRELVHSEPLDFDYVDCACPPGSEGTLACNYGRSCGVLKAAGKDVGEILIAEKLAVPFRCGTTGCPKTPRPWCEPHR